MNIKKVILMAVIVNILVLMNPFSLRSQEYDYHREESPAVSWNSPSFFDARMLGAGGVTLMASPAFSELINPALVPEEGNVVIGTSLQITKHQAFQYWGINQGVYIAPDPLSDTSVFPSGISVSVPVQSFSFSTGWYTPNLLDLPALNYNDVYSGYWVESKGRENALFAAAALRLGKINIGLKFDYVFGKRNVKVGDNWKSYPAKIMQIESHKLSYFAISLGAVMKISPAWTVETAVVYPLEGTAKRNIDRIFESDYERIEILGLQSKDTLSRPVRIHLGTSFTAGDSPGTARKNGLIIALEAVYSLWSDYKYEFYSEILPRDMKDTLLVGFGMEYNFSSYSVRLGYRYDPQPVATPDTVLHAISSGLGVPLGRVFLDIGAAFYFSDYKELRQKHLLLVCTVNIPLGGEK